MCIHLSDFPAPLTDLLTATSTSESAVIFASTASFKAKQTTTSPDIVNDENLLTPSSDMEMSHDGSGKLKRLQVYCDNLWLLFK